MKRFLMFLALINTLQGAAKQVQSKTEPRKLNEQGGGDSGGQQ
jgi:hypothetical protein